MNTFRLGLPLPLHLTQLGGSNQLLHKTHQSAKQCAISKASEKDQNKEMPSQSMKAENFLHTCFQKPSLSHQEDEENPTSNFTGSIAESRRFFASTTATSFFPTSQFTNHESLPSLEDAFTQFMDSYPHYSESYQIDEIRGHEYYHLSLTNRVCLDYFGIGLFAFSQFHNQLCWSNTTAASTSSPENRLQANSMDSPLFSMLYRSVNLKKELLNSSHESKLESAIKKRIRDFLSINADDYCVVLTANRTAAFKLLAESYPFQSNRKLLSVYDHHSEAVEGMTSTSVKRGAKAMAAVFSWPRLRIRSTKLKTMLVSKTKKRKKGLFVFQLQSRVTGARYSYQWMQIAQENGWHVVLDACALGPKDMDSLGLSLLQPDFLISSFYKVFGDDPTGFGCLFVKKTAMSILEDSKMAGIASIIPANRFLHPVDEPAESETDEERDPVSHLSHLKQDQAPDVSSNTWRAVQSDSAEGEIDESEPQNIKSHHQNHTNSTGLKQETIEFRCLDHVDSLGLTLINARGRYLTNWLINALTKLHHPNSEKDTRLVKLYGPKIKFDRGASLAFNVLDWKGDHIDPVLVQKLGDRKGITLGHGFLQNLWFQGKHEGEKGRVLEERKQGSGELGLKVVTAAFGYLVNFQDVYTLWAFVAQFLDSDFVEEERLRYNALNQSIL